LVVALIDDLSSDSDATRLEAARRAGRSGDQSLVDRLLLMALSDSGEVRWAFGLNDDSDSVSEAAADALATLVRVASGVDPRIRSAVLDLGADDERAAYLLRALGAGYRPLCEELIGHDEPRVRRRAVPSLVSGVRQDRAFFDRLVTHPAPELRVAALGVPWRERDADVVRRLFLEDPDATVRRAAARILHRDRGVDATIFLDALRGADDATPLVAIADCLTYRRGDRRALLALVRLLGHPSPGVRHAAVKGLENLDDALVATAVASRLPVEPDERIWYRLLRQPGLLTHAPELRPLVALWRRYSPADGRAPTWALTTALEAPSPSDGSARPHPAQGLDDAGRERLKVAVIRQAVEVVGPVVDALVSTHTEADALAAVRVWTEDQGERGLRMVEWAREREVGDWHTDPYAPRYEEVFKLLIAVEQNDLDYALRTMREVIVDAVLRDPALRGSDDDAFRRRHIAGRRGDDVARVLQILAGRLILAGADPLPAGPLQRLLPAGEDPVDGMRSMAGPAELRARRHLWTLKLMMRPAESARYREALLAAVPPGSEADPDPDRVGRLLVGHADGVVAAWLAACMAAAADGDPLPALRFGGSPATDVPAAELAEALRRLDWEARIRVWSHTLDRAATWLHAGRRPGDAASGESKSADEALERLTLFDVRDSADSADAVTGLRGLFHAIAVERVRTWELWLAAAVVAGEPWDADPLDDDVTAGAPLSHELASVAGREPGSVLLVRLSDGTSAVLSPGVPAPLAGTESPDRAGREVPCARCGAAVQIEGRLTWRYVDDDRQTHLDHGWAGKLTGTCGSCGAAATVETRLTLTRSRGDGTASLTWDL
jgi:hypothetical protein